MARGGYRRPSEQQSFSGVGKNSRRTDRQAIKNPRVQDSTDLQVNDGERIRQGQRVAPLGRTAPPSLAAAPPSGGSPSPIGGGGAELPPHLFSLPSARPGEPETEGLPFGPGAGPEALENRPDPDDDREYVLHFLSGPPFNNQAAADMLREIRQARVPAPAQMAPVMGEPEVTPVEEEMAPDLGSTAPMEEDLATEEGMAGEEVDQTSVETPATSSEEPLV